MRAPRHRAPGPALTYGWTRWSRHRAETAEPSAADGLEEFARKHFAAVATQAEAAKHRADVRVDSCRVGAVGYACLVCSFYAPAHRAEVPA